MGSQTNAPLPEGHLLDGYRILRKIANGGFAIVYLAEDEAGEKFAIKEYLPASLARRRAGELVPTIADEHLATYRNGLKCFFEEGRALARILHPNVVRVQNFFRANETVYLVMAFEEGRSLQELIVRKRAREQGVVVSERHIRRIFVSIMNGLRDVHAHRLLHLDVKPANIYLRRDGSPLLLDFGASRQTLTQGAPKLFPMYTPGFAAPELYRKNSALGPWADIYSLGASMFASMRGAPPQPSDQREQRDRLGVAYDALRRHYRSPLVDVVAWCLELDPLKRPQSVFALQKALREATEEPDEATRTGIGRWLDTLVGRLSADEEGESSSGRAAGPRTTPR